MFALPIMVIEFKGRYPSGKSGEGSVLTTIRSPLSINGA